MDENTQLIAYLYIVIGLIYDKYINGCDVDKVHPRLCWKTTATTITRNKIQASEQANVRLFVLVSLLCQVSAAVVAQVTNQRHHLDAELENKNCHWAKTRAEIGQLEANRQATNKHTNKQSLPKEQTIANHVTLSAKVSLFLPNGHTLIFAHVGFAFIHLMPLMVKFDCNQKSILSFSHVLCFVTVAGQVCLWELEFPAAAAVVGVVAATTEAAIVQILCPLVWLKIKWLTSEQHYCEEHHNKWTATNKIDSLVC